MKTEQVRILKLSGGRIIRQENNKLYYGISGVLVNQLSMDEIINCLEIAGDEKGLKKFEDFMGVRMI